MDVNNLKLRIAILGINLSRFEFSRVQINSKSSGTNITLEKSVFSFLITGVWKTMQMKASRSDGQITESARTHRETIAVNTSQQPHSPFAMPTLRYESRTVKLLLGMFILQL